MGIFGILSWTILILFLLHFLCYKFDLFFKYRVIQQSPTLFVVQGKHLYWTDHLNHNNIFVKGYKETLSDEDYANEVLQQYMNSLKEKKFCPKYYP